MAVKLNGETARTKPSSARYSTRLEALVRINGNKRSTMCGDSLPGSGWVLWWLLRIKFFHKFHSETEEVGKLKDRGLVDAWRGDCNKLLDLCRRIDFSLPSVLTLSEHCSGHEPIPILSANQICGFKENSCSVVPREGLPLFLCSKGTVDSIADNLLVSLVVVTEVLRVIRRNWLLNGPAGLDLTRIGP